MRATSTASTDSRRSKPGRRPVSSSSSRFLTIDIGGSGLKAAVVNRSGKMLTDRVRVKTPRRPSPKALVDRLVALVRPLAPFDCVSVGFPGVVRDGRIVTAPNLGTRRFRGFDLASALRRGLRRPVRVANDAELQGLAAIQGKGVELVLTLGTGFGSALFDDGRSLATFELAHHPFRKGETYEEQLGERALARVGPKKWSRRVQRALATLHVLLHYDRLYLGGGNARKLRFKIGRDTKIISNTLGVRGGAALWETPGQVGARARLTGPAASPRPPSAAR